MPASDTVHDRIMANVVSTLAAIASGSTFYTTVARVYEMDGNILEKVELPCAIVSHMGTEEYYGAIDQVECNLKLAISLAMQMDQSSSTWARDIRRFAEDVKAALRTDWGRGTSGGSANAFDTYIEGVEVANQRDGFPTALAQVNVRVQYRHLLTDPTVAI